MEDIQRKEEFLRIFLEELECETYWISEVDVLNKNSGQVETSCESYLSSSIVENNYPRCSTPVYSSDVPNFTLIASKAISRIRSSISESDETQEIQDTPIEEVQYIDDAFTEDVESDALEDFNAMCKNKIPTNRKSIMESSPKVPIKKENISSPPAISNPKTLRMPRIQLKKTTTTVPKKEKAAKMVRSITIDPKIQDYFIPSEIADEREINEKTVEITEIFEEKFTLNATRPISKVLGDDEEQFEMGIIRNLMNDIIWEVESEIEKENRLRTVMNMKRAAMRPKNRSKSVQIRQIKEEEDIRKDINVQKEISSPQVILDFPLKTTSRRRESLKRTVSEVTRGRKKAMRLIKEKSIHPVLTKEPTPVEPIENNDETTYYPSTSFTDSERMESEKVYTELTPLTSDSESTSAQTLNNYFESIGTLPMSTRWSRDVTSDDDWADATEGIGRFNETLRIDEAPLPQLDPSVHFEDYGQDYDDQYDNYQDDTKIVEEEREDENVGMDKEVEEEEKDDDIDEEEEAGPSISTRKSILTRKESATIPVVKQPKKLKKKVSFAAPHDVSVDSQSTASMNTTHIIKCQIPNCKTTYRWKRKYGKLRLIDHAMTHISEKFVECEKCLKSFSSTRQIRQHYSTYHKDLKPMDINMNELLATNSSIQSMYNKCYKDNLAILKRLSRAKGQTKVETRKTYSINCQFKDCTKVYKWNTREGKRILRDHVLSHRKNTRASRNSTSKAELEELWMKCYNDNLHIVGGVNKNVP